MKTVERTSILICGRSDRGYSRDETVVEALKRLPFRRIYDCRLLSSRWIERNTCTLKKRKGKRSAPFGSLQERISSLKIRTLLTARRVDLVFVMKWNEAFLRRWSARARNARIPVLYDLWVSRVLKARRDLRGEAFWKREEAAVCRRCDHLFALTEPYRSFYQEEHGLDTGRVTVLPLAVKDVWLDRPLPAEPPDGKGLTIAYWGTVIRHHGLDTALEAARRLNGDLPVKFVFYNAGRIRSAFPGVSFPENVRLLDWQEGTTELIQAVDRADLCLGHLSPSHDGHLVLPNKAIEAMARGKVVLHHHSEAMEALYAARGRGPGSVKLFRNGVNGLCEAITELFKDAPARGEIGRQARKRVKEDHTVSRLASALEEAVIRTRSVSA